MNDILKDINANDENPPSPHFPFRWKSVEIQRCLKVCNREVGDVAVFAVKMFSEFYLDETTNQQIAGCQTFLSKKRTETLMEAIKFNLFSYQEIFLVSQRKKTLVMNDLFAFQIHPLIRSRVFLSNF